MIVEILGNLNVILILFFISKIHNSLLPPDFVWNQKTTDRFFFFPRNFVQSLTEVYEKSLRPRKQPTKGKTKIQNSIE